MERSEDRRLLAELDLRDQASLIERELKGGREYLLDRIDETLGRYQRFGLSHALLASLGAREAVTTNYDKLYEQTCTRPGHKQSDALTVLPYDHVEANRPWLLKLHGCLGRTEHIVLTRSDYLGLARERSALFGIVQALLVTKHLLFVGYSLTDDDFHQLVEEIRIATNSASGPQAKFGTVLTVGNWPHAKLWDSVVHVQRIGAGSHEVSARRLQIVLDRVAHLATPRATHLLDAAFRGILEPEESEIADSLAHLQQTVRRVLNTSPEQPTAVVVQQMLERLGAIPDAR